MPHQNTSKRLEITKSALLSGCLLIFIFLACGPKKFYCPSLVGYTKEQAAYPLLTAHPEGFEIVVDSKIVVIKTKNDILNNSQLMTSSQWIIRPLQSEHLSEYEIAVCIFYDRFVSVQMQSAQRSNR